MYPEVDLEKSFCANIFTTALFMKLKRQSKYDITDSGLYKGLYKILGKLFCSLSNFLFSKIL